MMGMLMKVSCLEKDNGSYIFGERDSLYLIEVQVGLIHYFPILLIKI